MAKRSKKKSPTQFKLTCLYCGYPGSSKEHYFPQWMHQHFTHLRPRTKPAAGMSFATPDGGVFPLVITERDLGRSRVHDVVQRVCESCNNTWMSEIVAASRPALERYGLPAGLDRSSPISAEDQTAMSQWAVMTAISYVTAKQPAATTKFDRDFLRTKRAIPPGWYVRMARIDAPEDHAIIVETSVQGQSGSNRFSMHGPWMIICLIDCLFLVWRAHRYSYSVPHAFDEEAFFAIYPPNAREIRWDDEAVFEGSVVEPLHPKLIAFQMLHVGDIPPFFVQAANS